MQDYYQILRLDHERDIRGKSEEEIRKKIENNYKALVSRAPQMYSSVPLREEKLKEMEAARATLSDQDQRKVYDQRLESAVAVQKGNEVSIVVTCLSEEDEDELMANEQAE